MILSDLEIIKEIKNGNIILEPFNIENVQPASVDLKLGNTLKIYIDEVLDPKKENQTTEIVIPEEGFIMNPGELYLSSCAENIGISSKLGALVLAKSGIGRLGIDVIVGPAGWTDPGFGNNIPSSLVLEMRATRPVLIYPGMPICQMLFYRIDGVVAKPYGREGSKYQGQQGVQSSLYHLNFK